LIKRIVNTFNSARLDYMFTGALAASYYGTPRTTMDVDVVVEVTKRNCLTRLVSALKMVGLNADRRKIDSALRSNFRIVTFRDGKTPFTVDIILSRTKLMKKTGSILGLPTYYETPEGLILAKLRMIKATIPRERALKDEDDIKAILKFSKIHMNILKRRARKHNTLPILEMVTAGKF